MRLPAMSRELVADKEILALEFPLNNRNRPPSHAYIAREWPSKRFKSCGIGVNGGYGPINFMVNYAPLTGLIWYLFAGNRKKNVRMWHNKDERVHGDRGERSARIGNTHIEWEWS